MASELGVQTIQHTNGTDALTIGSDGSVLTPNRPAFSAWLDVTQTGLGINTHNTVVYDTVDFDTTSSFNTSTGVYTAPVTGIYQFSVFVNPDMSSGTADRMWGYFRIPNKTLDYQFAHLPTYASDRLGFSGSLIVDLTANDTIYVTTYVNQGTTYSHNGDDGQFKYNWFTGYLIG